MSAVSSTNSSINNALSTQTSSSELDREAFMTLLVTQFQYQDPLNPMEDKEFIAQLAQFSSLEQMMNMNESMQGLTDATKSQEMINATSFIGKNIDVSGTTISKSIDAEGNATVGVLNYALGQSALSGTIRVTNSEGIEVYSETLSARSAGNHTYTWNGKMSNGVDAPAGSYTLNPVFYDDTGKVVSFAATVDGLVTGVATDAGVTYLTLADGRVAPLTQVSRVSQVTTANTVSEDKDEENGSSTSSTTTTATNTTTGATTNSTNTTNTTNNTAGTETGETATTNQTNTQTGTGTTTGTNP